MPLPLHTVEGPEAEPDHTALLVQGVMNPFDDVWVRRQLLRILPWRLPQQMLFALHEELDLVVEFHPAPC